MQKIFLLVLLGSLLSCDSQQITVTQVELQTEEECFYSRKYFHLAKVLNEHSFWQVECERVSKYWRGKCVGAVISTLMPLSNDSVILIDASEWEIHNLGPQWELETNVLEHRTFHSWGNWVTTEGKSGGETTTFRCQAIRTNN